MINFEGAVRDPASPTCPRQVRDFPIGFLGHEDPCAHLKPTAWAPGTWDVARPYESGFMGPPHPESSQPLIRENDVSGGCQLGCAG